MFGRIPDPFHSPTGGHARRGHTMSDTAERQDDILAGSVKWFDTAKGFGFVVSPDADRDILLHANVLRNFGQNSISDGSRITLRVTHTPRGIQAKEVLSIAPPDLTDQLDDPRDSTLPFDDTLVGGDLEPARVKWFDRAKGFGFANVFGLNEDVFIHIEILRRSSLASLQPGEAVAIRVAQGERGRLATQVAVWESATDDQTELRSVAGTEWRLREEAAE